VHVGGVEIVLFIPAGSRQNDVGIDAGGRHPEVERDQQVELFPSAPRRATSPPWASGGPFRPDPCPERRGRAEQVLEEILVAFAR
jgi:hypothetical protein